MTEQADSQALIDIEEIRYHALAAHNIREAIERVSPVDASILTTCEVEYLRAHPQELNGHRRYAEVHIFPEGRPAILISPLGPHEPQNASVGGYHSLVDEISSFSDSDQAWYGQTINRTGLADASTATLAAKGYLVHAEDNTMQLELQVLHDRNGRPEAEWLTELLEEATSCGLDGGVTINPYDKTVSTGEQIKIVRRYEPSLNVVPCHNIPEAVRTPNMLQGIITSMQAGEARASHPYHGTINQTVPLELNTLMANSRIHNPLYEQAGITDSKGLLDVSVDGHPVRMGVRYTLDANPHEPQSSINIFYDKEYGDVVSSWEEAVIRAIREYIRYPQSENPLHVTTSVADGVPRIRQYAHAWMEY